jgi:alpha-D-xyloside xylohydrolase
MLMNFDTLRYRLLPYIYSLASMTSNQAYTLMPPLVMDFRSGHSRCQYQRSIHVRAGVLGESRNRIKCDEPPSLSATGWRSARTNSSLCSRWFDCAYGPEKEWSTQKPEDPIELRIYPGADGAFTLYEDENDNYNYESGPSPPLLSAGMMPNRH